jgi:hypothetical protein
MTVAAVRPESPEAFIVALSAEDTARFLAMDQSVFRQRIRAQAAEAAASCGAPKARILAAAGFALDVVLAEGGQP